MPRLRRTLGAAMAIRVVAAGAGRASAPVVRRAPGPLERVWEPHWAASAGATTFAAHTDVVGGISPFFLSAAADGTVITVSNASSMTDAIRAARRNGLKVIPTVTDGAGKGGMAAILADPGQRADHVTNLVDTVLAGNYDGIDLDYEVFAFTDVRSTWATT